MFGWLKRKLSTTSTTRKNTIKSPKSPRAITAKIEREALNKRRATLNKVTPMPPRLERRKTTKKNLSEPQALIRQKMRTAVEKAIRESKKQSSHSLSIKSSGSLSNKEKNELDKILNDLEEEVFGKV